MMMCSIAAGILALTVASPAAWADFRRSVPGDYAALGACAYSTLERLYPSQIRYVDLRAASTIRVTLQDTAGGLLGSAVTRLMDMEIRKAGRGADVAITSYPTIFGAGHYAERTWREISGCLS